MTPIWKKNGICPTSLLQRVSNWNNVHLKVIIVISPNLAGLEVRPGWGGGWVRHISFSPTPGDMLQVTQAERKLGSGVEQVLYLSMVTKEMLRRLQERAACQGEEVTLMAPGLPKHNGKVFCRDIEFPTAKPTNTNKIPLWFLPLHSGYWTKAKPNKNKLSLLLHTY